MRFPFKASRQIEDIRTAEKWISTASSKLPTPYIALPEAEKRGVKVNLIPAKDIPKISDSFLTTLCFPCSFPMTVILSWSPSMSTGGVMCMASGCG